MTSTVIMNSLFDKAVIGTRVSLSAVTLKRVRTDTLLEKYLQTNHCQIFVQLKFAFCLNRKIDMS